MSTKKKNQHNKSGKQPLSEADRLKESGTNQLNEGNYLKAIDFYSRAVELDKNNFAHYHNRSLAYFLVENYSSSLKDIRECKQLKPTYIQVYIREASALLELNHLIEAKESVIEGLKVEDTNIQLKELLKKIEIEIQEREVENQKINKEDADRINELLNWMKSENIDFSSIRFKEESSSERSLVASIKIQKGEPVFKIPLKLLITLDSAKQDPTILATDSSKLLSTKHSSFAVALIKQKLLGNKSPLFPYIQSLPNEFSSFPALFSEKELKVLEGTAFSKMVEEQKQEIQNDFQVLCDADSIFKENVKFEQYRWAYLCSRSRTFGIVLNEKQTTTLAPLADMINHRAEGKQNSEWIFDQENQELVVRALNQIQRNEEITFSYGRKCNSKLLLNYGFIDDWRNKQTDKVQFLSPQNKEQQEKEKLYKGINLYNQIPVLFAYDDPNEDPTLLLKAKLLGGDTIPKACLIRITEDYSEADSSGFLGYMRFIAIRDPIALSKLKESHDKFKESTNLPTLSFLPQKTPPLSIENEMIMWSKVQDTLIPILLQHKGSSKADEQILQDGNQLVNLSNNEKSCLLIRLGEKKVLEFYIDMANKMTELLKQKDKKKILELAFKDQSHLPFFQYMMQVVLARLLKQSDPTQSNGNQN